MPAGLHVQRKNIDAGSVSSSVDEKMIFIRHFLK